MTEKAAPVVEVDPWGLTSPEVKEDWTQMMSPPLMMFSCVFVFSLLSRTY